MPDFVDKKSNTISAELNGFSKQLVHSFGLFKHIRGVCISNGDINELTSDARRYVEESVELCQPESVHICDGSECENSKLLSWMFKQGTIIPLPKYDNCWLARTNPSDTARVESKTFIVTDDQKDTIPTPKDGVKGTLGNWMHPSEMNERVAVLFNGCMKGRTMYVVPFSMGPIGSPLSKIGIQLTDSAYVVSSMRIMTRMGTKVWKHLSSTGEGFVKALHSVGTPASGKQEMDRWPCDPERTLILHKPATNEIMSYGSGYGGNSLLGKKCFALRIGSTIAMREGWLAEHMLILGVTNPRGEKKYIAAAFPSACGKTNLAMMNPTLDGYKVECVGDDIAWMRFDNEGVLRAINPENGFFGVAPGTANFSNPNAMRTIERNTLFTNVACTSDGGVYWEGLEKETNFKGIDITDWRGRPWQVGDKSPSSHPNSRFCTPASQCPIIDPQWEAPEGVPISAILFGGRRPHGVPLIYEARDWKHGVFIGSAMRSEATAAAEHKGKVIMHDPFAMRPFFGYNFGKYLEHWLSMENKSERLPKIFHVNWFRKSADGQFLWPGFGENSRVIEWVLQRVNGDDVAEETAIGLIPKKDALNVQGLDDINLDELFSVPKDFWQQEVRDIQKYYEEQLPNDLPEEICKQLEILKQRVNDMQG